MTTFTVANPVKQIDQNHQGLQVSVFPLTDSDGWCVETIDVAGDGLVQWHDFATQADAESYALREHGLA